MWREKKKKKNNPNGINKTVFKKIKNTIKKHFAATKKKKKNSKKKPIKKHQTKT